jgi:hypothetical protein
MGQPQKSPKPLAAREPSLLQLNTEDDGSVFGKGNTTGGGGPPLAESGSEIDILHTTKNIRQAVLADLLRR